MKESRLHIPILFANDTIHGYRTVSPIPLGTASSFDPGVAATDHRIGARESAAVGLKQIYSPMVDVSHEPRWGRIAEAGGEDPYLNSVFAAARVKAAQGDDYGQPELYLHDPVASISQPVRRLRGFERVTLAKGQKQTVGFTLDAGDFGFYDNRGRFVVEPGRIDVYAGDSSKATLTQSFTVR